jgi:hypothetical protein
MPAWARAALTHPVFTGISRQHLGELIASWPTPGPPPTRVYCTNGAAMCAAGAGPKQRLVFFDRVLVTLVCPRFQLPHQALAVLYGGGPLDHHPCGP